MMSTSDKSLNRRTLGKEDWAPFEMASLHPVVKPAPDQQTGKSAALPDTASLRLEIQKLQEAARKRGHAEGYAAGHEQGLAAGLEEGRKLGHDEGYTAGHEAGHTAGSGQARQATEQLLTLADECAASLATIEQETGQALISLAIQIAEQVLRTTLKTQPDTLLALIQDITHQENDKDAVLKLRLNPDDLDLVRQYLDKEPGVGLWRLLPDSSITRGGCIAETGLGDIDATLQTRWQRVVAALGHTDPFSGAD